MLRNEDVDDISSDELSEEPLCIPYEDIPEATLEELVLLSFHLSKVIFFAEEYLRAIEMRLQDFSDEIKDDPLKLNQAREISAFLDKYNPTLQTNLQRLDFPFPQLDLRINHLVPYLENQALYPRDIISKIFSYLSVLTWFRLRGLSKGIMEAIDILPVLQAFINKSGLIINTNQGTFKALNDSLLEIPNEKKQRLEDDVIEVKSIKIVEGRSCLLNAVSAMCGEEGRCGKVDLALGAGLGFSVGLFSAFEMPMWNALYVTSYNCSYIVKTDIWNANHSHIVNTSSIKANTILSKLSSPLGLSLHDSLDMVAKCFDIIRGFASPSLMDDESSYQVKELFNIKTQTWQSSYGSYDDSLPEKSEHTYYHYDQTALAEFIMLAPCLILLGMMLGMLAPLLARKAYSYYEEDKFGIRSVRETFSLFRPIATDAPLKQVIDLDSSDEASDTGPLIPYQKKT